MSATEADAERQEASAEPDRESAPMDPAEPPPAEPPAGDDDGAITEEEPPAVLEEPASAAEAEAEPKAEAEAEPEPEDTSGSEARLAADAEATPAPTDGSLHFEAVSAAVSPSVSPRPAARKFSSPEERSRRPSAMQCESSAALVEVGSSTHGASVMPGGWEPSMPTEPKRAERRRSTRRASIEAPARRGSVFSSIRVRKEEAGCQTGVELWDDLVAERADARVDAKSKDTFIASQKFAQEKTVRTEGPARARRAAALASRPRPRAMCLPPPPD